MLKLKTTEEYRTDSELEAKEAIEQFRAEANEKGYEISSCGYTYKIKKSKGEIIDEAYVVKVVKNFSPVFDI